MATLDPFKPWKRAERVWVEARRLGFEVVVVLDDRTSFEDTCKVRRLADKVIRWKSDGHVEDAYVHVQQCSEDFVLMISDDEEPSRLLWQFASEPPFAARFAFPVIPILDGKVWKKDLGEQERLVYRKGWKWIPRALPDGTMTTFEGRPDGVRQVIIKDNPGAVIWHYYLYAPREERTEKAERYARIDQSTVAYHLERQLWEEHPELLIPLPKYLEAQLPKE